MIILYDEFLTSTTFSICSPLCQSFCPSGNEGIRGELVRGESLERILILYRHTAVATVRGLVILEAQGGIGAVAKAHYEDVAVINEGWWHGRYLHGEPFAELSIYLYALAAHDA